MTRVFCCLICLFAMVTNACGEKFHAEIITSRMLHLQYKAEGLAEELKTADRDLAKRYSKDGFLFLETKHLTLRYLIDSEIHQSEQSAEELRISFPLGQHNVVWYPGKGDALNLKGLLPNEGNSISADPREDLLPGLVSRAGWSIVELAPTTDASFDLLFLGYGHDYEGAVKDFKATPFYRGKNIHLCPTSATPLQLPHLVATATNAGATYWGLPWSETLRDDYLGVRLMQLSAFLPEEKQALPDSIIELRIDSLHEARAIHRAFDLHRSMRTYKDSIQELGEIVCRPLYYDFPADNNAYIYEDEFLCGHEFLVAPIMQKPGSDGLARRAVWLPAGRWMDVVNHRVQEGPRLIHVECSTSDTPYFRKL